jgi:complex III assembly factor LYRM7
MAARSVYRVLLRARADAFRGDARALAAARDEIRSKFELERGETDPQRVRALLQDGHDAAAFLRDFVVQAALNERGNLAVAFNPAHSGKEVDLSGDGVQAAAEAASTTDSPADDSSKR